MKIATLAIIIRGGKVLLGKKQGGPEIGEGTINAPGGKVELGESLIDCVVRETEEETCLVLHPEHLEKVAVITFHAANEPIFEVHCYRTGVFDGEPWETPSMVPGWYDINNLPFDRMLESDRHWLPNLIRGEKFRTNVYYREKVKGYLGMDDFLPFTE